MKSFKSLWQPGSIYASVPQKSAEQSSESLQWIVKEWQAVLPYQHSSGGQGILTGTSVQIKLNILRPQSLGNNSPSSTAQLSLLLSPIFCFLTFSSSVCFLSTFTSLSLAQAILSVGMPNCKCVSPVQTK